MSIARLMQQAAAGGGVETDPNFANVSLLLHGDGTSGAQNNTFLDSSTNNFTITRNGNATQGSFSPYNVSGPYDPATHGGSGYFNGTGDYLSIAANSLVNIGSDQFNIECWVYLISTDRYSGFYHGATGGSLFFGLFEYTTRLLLSKQGANLVIAPDALPLNEWVHVAASRDGSNVIRLFVNGSLVASGTHSDTFASSVMDIPRRNKANTFYISDLRLVKGTALYTSAFTPPTAPLTAVTDTSLLCSFTNAGIFDSTAKNVLETVGNAQIDTAVTKFGTGSMEFDGTGDWLKAPNSTELQFGTGDFTVEFWVYLATGDAGSNRGLVAKGGASTGWLVSLNTSENVVFTYTTSTITSTGSINLDAWNHIAVVREGTGSNETKIYINGTNDGTGTVSTNFNQTQVMYIGANRAAGDPMKGYIDDLRITKGVARYTAAFTPPTKAFPDQ